MWYVSSKWNLPAILQIFLTNWYHSENSWQLDWDPKRKAKAKCQFPKWNFIWYSGDTVCFLQENYSSLQLGDHFSKLGEKGSSGLGVEHPEEKHCGHLDMLFVASSLNHELKLHALCRTCYGVGSYSEIWRRIGMELCSLYISLSLVLMNIYVHTYICIHTLSTSNNLIDRSCLLLIEVTGKYFLWDRLSR